MSSRSTFDCANPTLANRIYRFRIPTRLRATTVIVHVHLVRPHHPPGPSPTILPCTTCPHLPSKQNAVAPRGNDCIPRSARPPVRCMPCCRDRRVALGLYILALVLVHRRDGFFASRRTGFGLEAHETYTREAPERQGDYPCTQTWRVYAHTRAPSARAHAPAPLSARGADARA